MLVLAAPRAARACPVCFGQNDSPMAAAANLAIIVMLVIVGGVLAAFASFIIYLRRRAQLVAAESGPPTGLEPARAEGGHVEGTAQC
jgi:heme/copper-type cytochrome/quinol oxidase subunit 2